MNTQNCTGCPRKKVSLKYIDNWTKIKKYLTLRKGRERYFMFCLYFSPKPSLISADFGPIVNEFKRKLFSWDALYHLGRTSKSDWLWICRQRERRRWSSTEKNFCRWPRPTKELKTPLPTHFQKIVVHVFRQTSKKALYRGPKSAI